MQVTYEAAKQRCESLEKNLEPLLKEIRNVESEQENLKKKSKIEVLIYLKKKLNKLKFVSKIKTEIYIKFYRQIK